MTKPNDILIEITKEISELPALPDVILKSNALLSNPRSSITELGAVISSDQIIAAKIIRVVNSALYGFPGRISSINHALVILGFSAVKNILLTTAILSNFNLKQEIHGFSMQSFWRHSLATGCVAQVLALHTLQKNPDEAFVAGLLHDIGKIILTQTLPEKFYKAVEIAHNRNILIAQSEKEIFGFDHSIVGKLLAEKWNLPENLQATIAYHHHPQTLSPHSDLIKIVHAADIIARGLLIGHPGDKSIPIMDIKTWEHLNINDKEIDEILIESLDAIKKSEIFLEINN
ncbi:MAG: HDOD domain-containing protein [Fibrobacter sp.]|nr:HDOD domain-containing protein [Fibrobacter sp.]